MYDNDTNAHGYDQHYSDSDEPLLSPPGAGTAGQHRSTSSTNNTFDHEMAPLTTSSVIRNRTTNQATRRRRQRDNASTSVSHPAHDQHLHIRTTRTRNYNSNTAYDQEGQDRQLPQHFANRNLQRKKTAVTSLFPIYKNNNNSNSNNRTPRGLRTRSRTGRWYLFQILIFGVALVAAVAYGSLFWKIFLEHQGQDLMGGSDIGSFFKPHTNHYDLSLPHDLATPVKSQAANKVLDLVLSDQRLLLEQSQARIEERQRRSRPNSFAFDASGIELYNSLVKPYSFQFLNDVVQGDVTSPSLIDEKESGHGHGHGHGNATRCGIDAQTAFAINPLAYSDIHAIREDSVVLIVGILGQLGFHLALKLATECNVQVMIGVDPMFPNESKYRLQLLEQISILYAKVPDLKKPLIVSFQGINPRKNYDSSFKEFFNSTTGDFDFGAYAAPTHVVHVFSDDTYSFHDGRGRDDSDSPYSSNDGLFAMRQSLVATEQLLSKLGESQSSRKFHFTFISDPGVLKDASTSDGDKKQGIYTVTKMMQEILIQSYSRRLGGHSFVTLRVPKVYGPWGKLGCFDYDLAQKAVMHWHDKDTMERSLESDESVLLQLSGHAIQSKIEHDVLFVDGKSG